MLSRKNLCYESLKMPNNENTKQNKTDILAQYLYGNVYILQISFKNAIKKKNVPL